MEFCWKFFKKLISHMLHSSQQYQGKSSWSSVLAFTLFCSTVAERSLQVSYNSHSLILLQLKVGQCYGIKEKWLQKFTIAWLCYQSQTEAMGDEWLILNIWLSFLHHDGKIVGVRNHCIRFYLSETTLQNSQKNLTLIPKNLSNVVQFFFFFLLLLPFHAREFL